MNSENRNFVAFVVTALALFLLYEYFVIGPSQRRMAAERAQAAAHQTVAAQAAAPKPNLTRAQALAASPRIRFDTRPGGRDVIGSPSIYGSIALRGARIDDVFLSGYRETVDPNSPAVELLRPEGMDAAYFAEFGWVGENLAGAPTPDTLWTVTSGDTLTPGHPVVLTHEGEGGLRFTRAIAVDDKAMFTITDTVANLGPSSVTLAPYASVQRQGLPTGLGASNIVHEGAVGALGLDKAELKEAKYKGWKKKGEIDYSSRGGWLGITDKYWMTAFVPGQSEHIDAKYRVTPDSSAGVDIYEVTYSAAARAIAPGRQITETTHLFAGAKTLPLLNGYRTALGVPRFDDAVDWGFLFFLTKPIFMLTDFYANWVGKLGVVEHFGLAILMLTVSIRLIMFPLANTSFEMGVKMKKLQPQLQELQKKYKEDPPTLQKEMMALYGREKVNPLTGCFPIFLQIPVFYSLTKIFTVTIEMRHAPFFGWIKDLSARDPTTFLNLFGVIPWDPAHTPLIGGFLDGMLHVGAWPLAYGFVTFLSQSMTPMTGVDPLQARMLKLMPILFTFILAQYAVGLLIYWTWSGLITILQQYVIMRRFKVDNPIDGFFARFSSKPNPTAAE